jgi:hypothetical protein
MQAPLLFFTAQDLSHYTSVGVIPKSHLSLQKQRDRVFVQGEYF